MLSPNGHVEHHLVLADLDGTTWADVEPGTGAALRDLPRRMRFLLRVEPALRDRRSGPCSASSARRATEVLAAAGLPGAGAPVRGRAAGRRASSAACPRSATAARRCSTSSSRGPRSGAVADRLLARRRCAGGRPGVRGAPGRGPPSAARRGQRPPHDPQRAELADHRRPPGQGLLPRPGDRRARAQPRPAAAAAGPAAPGRRQRGAGRAGDAGARRHPRGRPGRQRRPPLRARRDRAGAGEAVGRGGRGADGRRVDRLDRPRRRARRTTDDGRGRRPASGCGPSGLRRSAGDPVHLERRHPITVAPTGRSRRRPTSRRCR